MSSSTGVLMGTLATPSSLVTTASPASVMGTLTYVNQALATPRPASASSVLATRLAGTVSAAKKITMGTPAGQSRSSSPLILYTNVNINPQTMM